MATIPTMYLREKIDLMDRRLQGIEAYMGKVGAGTPDALREIASWAEAVKQEAEKWDRQITSPHTR